jgi:hypothetical protein
MCQVGREDRERVGGRLLEQLAVVGKRCRRGQSAFGDPGRKRLCRNLVRIGARDDTDGLEGQEPIEMDPRCQAAADDPDPEH